MDKKTYYFIGINGIGMSGLAEILINKGQVVLGSDNSPTLRSEHFKSLGIGVFEKQEKQNILSKEWMIVISSAIKDDNEELVQAKNLGCQIIKRGKLLAMIFDEFEEKIAVIGTHGKTTTTSLVIKIFSEQVEKPSYFVGGHLEGVPHAKLQSSKTFITELDESDGSFLDATPTSTIITNIEHEHIDFYKTKNDVVDAFLRFISNTINNNGKCTINIDDPISEKLYKKYDQKDAFITYGVENKESQIRAENIDYKWNGISFDLIINNTAVETVQLNLFGRHNVYNALAAIAIAMSKDILLKHILNALKSFSGVKRRLELKYKANDITLFDDYAHHPTEILTTLEGLYKSHTNHRIITIFQPHRYSRLTNLFDAFAGSFDRSDITLIVPVFSVGENEENNKNSVDLTKKINERNGNALYCNSFEEVTNALESILQANDIILLMGAGNITSIAKTIIPLIKKKR
jgi:UDP-N-acetylmuramate--alanine ligase